MSKEKSMVTIGGRICYVRKGIARLNQASFAASVGLPQSSLSEMETDRKPPKDVHIKAIAYRYSLNERWLLTGEGEMFSTPSGRSGEGGRGTCCVAGVGELPQETKEALAMAAEVLTSDTKYARLLAENIKSLHESIRFTQRIENLEGDLTDTRQTMINVVERLAAIETAERERLKNSKREVEETPPPASCAEESQKTAS